MPREHTIEDFLKLWTVSSLNSDGDGDNLAIAISRTTHEKKQPTEATVLVCSSKDGKVISKYSEKNARNFSPALNADGTKVAFVQKTSKGNSLVVNDLTESISEKIELDGECQQIKWAGESILLIMEDPLHPKTKEKREDGMDGTFFEEEDRYTSLYQYFPGRGLKKLTSGLQVWEFGENSGRVVMVASEKPHERFWFRAKLYGLTLGKEPVDMLYDPGWRSLASPNVSKDGGKVLFTESLRSDRGLTAGDLLLYDFSTKKATNLSHGEKMSIMNSTWTENGGISSIWLMEGHFGISRYDGKWKEIWGAEGTALPGFSSQLAYKNGTYFVGFTDRKTPPEIYAIKEGSSPRKISDINSGLSDLIEYPTEIVRWKSGDGLEIYGILRSLGPDRPLVVDVHGGPTAASTVSFLDRGTLLLVNGFSVFYPNYRGSTGKGRAYAESNRGDMGGKDFQDIMDGINFLKKSGKIANDNIFITGGSYGGFMTSWAVTQTDIFKAAVGLFGISDWYSFHGTSNLSDWDQIHYDDDPYTGQLYRKFSPMHYIQNVKTPILLMHGADDPYVPVGQYYQYYRGLNDLKKTVRLLVFPREGHGFTERKHFEQYQEEMIKWFRKYMD